MPNGRAEADLGVLLRADGETGASDDEIEALQALVPVSGLRSGTPMAVATLAMEELHDDQPAMDDGRCCPAAHPLTSPTMDLASVLAWRPPSAADPREEDVKSLDSGFGEPKEGETDI